MKKLLILILILTGINCYVITQLISPASGKSIQSDFRNDIRVGLIYLGCPRKNVHSIANGIEVAVHRTGIEGLLIASLLRTESNFRSDTVSRKGYKGLMQTPTATKIPLIDICHGADILKEKLKIANGNMFHALTLYKGGLNPEARKQAKQVLAVYHEVKRMIG